MRRPQTLSTYDVNVDLIVRSLGRNNSLNVATNFQEMECAFSKQHSLFLRKLWASNDKSCTRWSNVLFPHLKWRCSISQGFRSRHRFPSLSVLSHAKHEGGSKAHSHGNIIPRIFQCITATILTLITRWNNGLRTRWKGDARLIQVCWTTR